MTTTTTLPRRILRSQPSKLNPKIDSRYERLVQIAQKERIFLNVAIRIGNFCIKGDGMPILGSLTHSSSPLAQPSSSLQLKNVEANDRHRKSTRYSPSSLRGLTNIAWKVGVLDWLIGSASRSPWSDCSYSPDDLEKMCAISAFSSWKYRVDLNGEVGQKL